jgi:hypothetical protein
VSSTPFRQKDLPVPFRSLYSGELIVKFFGVAGLYKKIIQNGEYKKGQVSLVYWLWLKIKKSLPVPFLWLEIAMVYVPMGNFDGLVIFPAVPDAVSGREKISLSEPQASLKFLAEILRARRANGHVPHRHINHRPSPTFMGGAFGCFFGGQLGDR